MTKEEYAKVVAANLKRLAYGMNKTQVQIAKETGISQATLSCWMNGIRTPKVDSLDALCEYFRCTRADIMEPYEPRPLGKITGKELKIIEAYRTAPEGVQDSVLILLGLKERG